MTSSQQSHENSPLSESIIAFTLAISAAILIKLPTLFGFDMDQNESFYIRNMSFFVLPLLTIYFIWKRKTKFLTSILLAFSFALALIFANIYPFNPGGDTEILLALHLPVALWLIVGIAFSGGCWNRVDGRMDFVRFTGEFFIYYVLIALGGGVLTGFMALIFSTIAIDIEPFFESWLLPCGVAGAVIIAGWLVETRQSVMQNLAPMLARLFTPFFTLLLITFLGTLLWSGRALEIERNTLIVFDSLLVVVLGLLLYSVSSRDPQLPPGVFDVVQIILVVAALFADTIALWAISARITEFGFTPNRVVALGLNVLLLVNLAWSAVLYIRFLRGQSSFNALESWQTDYLPVYGAWAAIVVIIIPPLFGFK